MRATRKKLALLMSTRIRSVDVKELAIGTGLVLLSFAASFIAGRWALLAGVSSGVRTIFLTVAISLGAAVLFPIKDPEGAAERA